MSIFFEAENGLFRIETANTEYQMKVDKYGVLRHIWYGKRVGTDMSYLIEYPDVGFSGNIYEAENNRTYSLDTMPQEYPSFGTGDFRISAISVTHADGSDTLDLRYDSHKIKSGKYSIEGMPAVYADENDAETLEITLKDTASDVYVVLKYGVIEKYDIITRSAVIVNKGKSEIILGNAVGLCLDIPHGKWEMLHFHGRHASERLAERVKIMHGVSEISSTRGTSSHQHNPSAVFCSPDCTEESGDCIGMFLVYSGSFSLKTELDQMEQLRITMGINPDVFSWKLAGGEHFETPEAVITYSTAGFARMSHNFHRTIRENICRGKYKLAERPVLINNWETTYFDFDSEKIIRIAENAAKLGVDMLVLDDGWFGKRDSDCSGLGDWFVNENKLKGGLCGLVEKIKALGMKFGIWFEPEMVSEDSELYRTHPDWAIKIPNRKPVRSRFQLVLDMSVDDVRDYLYDCISNILKSADISYVKWDMNRSICDLYSAVLPADRQKELSHRYVLGVYALLERLTHDFPDVLFEGCSGGGGRFDAGMLYYCPQIWCSDDTDAYERSKIQYGTSFIYPISSVGSHVSVVPNHQTGRVTPLEARAITAMAGNFGYELDLNLLDDDEKTAVKEQIRRFKRHGSLIHNGKYYRLSNPMTDNYALWSFVSENEVLVQGMIFHTEPNMRRKAIRLKGLNENSNYYNTETNEKYSASALMNGGIILPMPWGDYFPVEIHLKKVDE